MPIAFVRVRFLNTLRNGGACKALSYLGRKAILDERLGRTFDYASIARDLVYEGLLLPDGASFTTVAQFANALDEAERKRQRKSTGRTRWPQFGVQLISALPPESELTLDEAVELAEHLAHLAVRGSSLPVYVAIHDPALEKPGAVTRHAHILIGLREIAGKGLSSRKVRNLFAAPKHATQPNIHGAYVAEGFPWPEIARDLQNGLFAEVGSNALVDPPAPFGGRHWSAKTLRLTPDRRTRHDQSVDRRNVELINGDPAILVSRMLRGRAVMRIDEVRALLARFLDSADDREWRLDEILTDTRIATFANDPAESLPRWLTTDAVHERIRQALAVVDRATIVRRQGLGPPPSLQVVIASSEATLVSALVNRLPISPRPIRRPLILGQRQSECYPLAAATADAKPIVATFAALKADPPHNRRGPSGKIGLRRGGLVFVPHAENIGDQDLASLVLRARQFGARIVLGYDVSRASPSCSLAARLADRLGESVGTEAEDVARDLRTGLIDRACRALHRNGKVRFGTADREAREAADFVVCGDPARLADVDLHVRNGSSDSEGAGVIKIEGAQGSLALRVGQWVVLTRSDYTTAQIRAGRFARVVAAPSPDLLEVVHPDGGTATLDLRAFPHIRSADAITIREARHAPRDAGLLIELTPPEQAWSAAVLAAAHPGRAVIHVDPSVANNLDEWIAIVARSKPAPLLTDLTPRKDPHAELNALMQKIYLGTDVPKRSEIERQPIKELKLEEWIDLLQDPVREPPASVRNASPETDVSAVSVEEHFNLSEAPTDRPGGLSDEQRRRLHDDLRAAIYWNADTRRGLSRLQSALAPASDQRNLVAQDLLGLCPADGPMAALLKVLLDRPERTAPDEFDDLELPSEMTAETAHAWTAWEIWQFRTDLRTMAGRHSNWPMPFDEVTRDLSSLTPERPFHERHSSRGT